MIRRQALLALACAAAALTAGTAWAQNISGKLVLYTSQPNADAQKTVDAFEAACPGVEVEWVRDGTTRIMAKLRAEFAAGRPQPDVLLISDMVTMAGLKQEGHLMADPDVDVSAYDRGLYDPDKTYFSTKLITTGIVYNSSAGMVPASYKDLLRPEAQNTIAMPSPMTSGAATIMMDAITADPALGWDFYAELASQGANPQGGNGGVYKAVAGGDKLYGFVVDYLPIRAMQDGAPVKFIFPEEGVSAVTEPVAILKTTKNVPAAKAFVSFLLSRTGQQLASDMGYLPADPEITAPAGFPPRSDIRLLPFDPARALAEDKQNKDKFLEIFGG